MDIQLIEDPRWYKRMETYFDSVCLGNNETLTIEEIQQWATNMEVMCKATATEMVKLRAQLYIFWGQVGLLPGKELTKKEFVKGMNKLGIYERERKEKGQVTYHEMISNAFFDVIDTNKDGILTVEDLRAVLKASDMNPSSAEGWLLAADTNKNGAIEREELFDSEFNFWFKPD